MKKKRKRTRKAEKGRDKMEEQGDAINGEKAYMKGRGKAEGERENEKGRENINKALFLSVTISYISSDTLVWSRQIYSVPFFFLLSVNFASH